MSTNRIVATILVILSVTSNVLSLMPSSSSRSMILGNSNNKKAALILRQTTMINKFMEKADPDEKYLVFKPIEDHDHDDDDDDEFIIHGSMAGKAFSSLDDSDDDRPRLQPPYQPEKKPQPPQQQQQRKRSNLTIEHLSNVTSISTQELEYYKRLSHNMSLVISPILLVIGGIGNPLCILILLRKRRANSTIVYLCFLAVFDILVLYTGLLRQYLKQIADFDIRDLSSLTCKLHIFLTYTFMQISSYILVAVTVNRLAITYNRTMCCKQKTLPNPNSPNQTRRGESNTSVYVIFGLICLAVSIWNVHFLIYYDLEVEDKQSSYVDDCTISRVKHADYYRFRIRYYSQMHLYFFIAVPCFVLFVANILIIKKIMQLSNPRLRTSRAGSMAAAGGGGNNAGAVNMRNEELLARKKERKKTRLSLMLLAVCLWFMILKTPASLYITFPVAEMNKSHFPFTYTLFMLINYTNHAVNLILYILTSATFRRDFKEVFCLLVGQRAPTAQAARNGHAHENGAAGVAAEHNGEHLKLNQMGDAYADHDAECDDE